MRRPLPFSPADERKLAPHRLAAAEGKAKGEGEKVLVRGNGWNADTGGSVVRQVNRFVSIAGAILAFALLTGCATSRTPTSGPAFVAARGCEHMIDQQRSTFVLHEVRSGSTFVCNADRAGRRLTPASTFKVPHALIALETGVVSDEHARFDWDGRRRGVAAWDKDTSLAEAVAQSTVWVFQSVASRVGHQRESSAVRRLNYGNERVGERGDLRHFWLAGPLAISAAEQVRFLTDLRAGRLQAGKRNQERTVAMLRLGDCGPGCTVYGKTGAVLPIDDQGFLREGDTSLLPDGMERTGWFVGWVERADSAGGPVVFAHTLDLALPGAMAARTEVAYKILRENGLPNVRGN